MPLTLTKRPRIERTELTTRRYWHTPNRQAEIVEVRWHHPLAYGRYFLLVVHSPKLIIERRRTKQAAIKSLAAKINQPKSRSAKR